METMSNGTAVAQQCMMPRTWDMPGESLRQLSPSKRNRNYLIQKHRSYISFDILRRILSDYFGYNVLYVMNITDIDDKIIKRARQNYLYERYVAAGQPLEQILNDHKAVLDQFQGVVEGNTDPDKKILLDRLQLQWVPSECLSSVAKP